MIVNLLVLALFVSLQQFVSASNEVFTQKKCYTHLTSPSPKGQVPTTWRLKTTKITRTAFKTNTPLTTKTPSTKIARTTVTSTRTIIINVPQVTDTYTQVATSVSTITVVLPTQTITTTSTSSTTTTESVQVTSTVSPLPDWLPIADTLPGSNTEKRRTPVGSSLLADRAAKKPAFCAKPPKNWPAAVTCVGVVKSFVVTTVTRTAHKTKTITAPTPTSTITSTTVVTSTSLANTPNAETTTTTTTVIHTAVTLSPSTTTTTITTTTSTSTVNLPGPTVYAQCSPRNLARHISGFAINYFNDRTGQLGVASTSDTTAEACCNSCAANPQCAALAFDSQAGSCLLGIAPTTSCSSGQYSIAAGYDSQHTNVKYVLANGACGAFNINNGAS